MGTREGDFIRAPKFKPENIRCVECGETFVFGTGEQSFYWAKGLAKPKRCRKCRERRKATIDGREVRREDA